MKPEEIQKYRLAALLHDVGHYPFSHALEEAIENYYKSSMVVPAGTGAKGKARAGVKPIRQSYKHEEVGKRIVEGDRAIAPIIKAAGYDPSEVAGIFRREGGHRFANLISSDLDADRIDYILRTAHHTGLPYGSIDLPYLLTQVRLDSKERICLSPKAIRAADHFLLCRYFDYQQVAFHKTVAGLEMVLKDICAQLLETGLLKDCSAEWVDGAIRDGQWAGFDDGMVMQLIRRLHDTTDDPNVRGKAACIINRTPPKIIDSIEKIKARGPDSRDEYAKDQQMINDKLNVWAKDFRIDRSLWYLWSGRQIELTKIGSHVPVSYAHDPAVQQARGSAQRKERDRYEQAVRILMDRDTNTSEPLNELPNSLMSVLSDYAFYDMRIYVLLPKGKEHLREEIRERIRTDLPNHSWNRIAPAADVSDEKSPRHSGKRRPRSKARTPKHPAPKG